MIDLYHYRTIYSEVHNSHHMPSWQFDAHPALFQIQNGHLVIRVDCRLVADERPLFFVSTSIDSKTPNNY